MAPMPLEMIGGFSEPAGICSSHRELTVPEIATVTVWPSAVFRLTDVFTDRLYIRCTVGVDLQV